MIAPTPRPNVFVSSTIGDLGDLRGAVKYWLEELGFDVQLSEFNDFIRRPEANAFEACFDAIRSSDYYVLLVGRTRGTWYDGRRRISVTQQEYRTAYESATQTGAPRLLLYVRAEVETALAERRMTQSPRRAPSLLKDPSFTTKFLREIRREHETRQAVAGVSAEFPASNWVSRFAAVRDLLTDIQQTMRITQPLPVRVVLENLRDELSRNLRTMLRKGSNGVPRSVQLLVNPVRERITLAEQDMRQGSTTDVDHDGMKRLIMFITGAVRPDALPTAALDHAVASGALLRYDRVGDRFEPSDLLKHIHRLREDLYGYSVLHRHVMEDLAVWNERWNQSLTTQQSVRVDNLSLYGVFRLHDVMHDVAQLTLGTLRFIRGKSRTVEVDLRSRSPVAEFEEEVRRERVSPEELEEWLDRDDAQLQAAVQ